MSWPTSGAWPGRRRGRSVQLHDVPGTLSSHPAPDGPRRALDRACRAADDPAWDRSPAWSPDGTTISLRKMASALQSNLWIVPAAGGEETQVTFGSGENGNPAWSPTGA
jgi:hypothetical protein